MLAELSRLRCWAFKLCSWLNAAVRSYFIISQHSLKKIPVKPSGPGALSLGMEKIVFLISSCVKRAPSEDRSCCWYPSKGQWKVAGLIVDVPRCCRKWSVITFSLSSCRNTGPLVVCKHWMKFFLFLEFARSWKNFVLASPKRIYVSLEHWRILDFSIIANPTERTFSRLRSSSSSCDSDQSSWAVSRRRMISLTIASCSFVSPIFIFFPTS